MAALQSMATALAQQHAYCGASAALRGLGWQLWLGLVAVAGHAQQLLSGADVAALLLSRRLLLQRDCFELADQVGCCISLKTILSEIVGWSVTITLLS